MSFEDLMPEVQQDIKDKKDIRSFIPEKKKYNEELKDKNEFNQMTKKREELVVFEETHFMNHILETIYAHLKKNEIMIFSFQD